MKRKDFLLIIVPVAIQSILYFCAKLFAFDIHLIGTNLDKQIPFIPSFVYFYVLWYILLIAIPYLLFKYDQKKLKDYSKMYILASIICFIIYVLYPTTINRATFEITSLSTYIVDLIYIFDTPALNCFPSFHCLNCFMWIYYMIITKNIPKYIKKAVIVVAILIILSTLFIKQHVIYDVIGALIVVIISQLVLKNDY